MAQADDQALGSPWVDVLVQPELADGDNPELEGSEI
jgi:hypothetical protein